MGNFQIRTKTYIDKALSHSWVPFNNNNNNNNKGNLIIIIKETCNAPGDTPGFTFKTVNKKTYLATQLHVVITSSGWPIKNLNPSSLPNMYDLLLLFSNSCEDRKDSK